MLKRAASCLAVSLPSACCNCSAVIGRFWPLPIQDLTGSPKPACCSLATIAFKPPWLPLPRTSLSTTGSTAPSSCPSAPLNAGEFSNESRIPMVKTLSREVGSGFRTFSNRPSRHHDRRYRATDKACNVFERSGRPVRVKKTRQNENLELRAEALGGFGPLDHQRLGKPVAGPFLHGRMRQHGLHVIRDIGRHFDRVGVEAIHHRREH